MDDELKSNKGSNSGLDDSNNVDSNSENSTVQADNSTNSAGNKKNGKKGSKALQEVLMNDNMTFLSNFDPEFSNRERRKLSRKINADGESARSAAEKINSVHGGDYIRVKTAKKWYKRFKHEDGEINVTVKSIPKSDPKLTIDPIVVKLSSSNGTVFCQPKEIGISNYVKKKNNGVSDENGGSEKDVCDCLIDDCPGCHFPCPKCRSYKCGFECRVNRKWAYESIENETDTGGNIN